MSISNELWFGSAAGEDLADVNAVNFDGSDWFTNTSLTGGGTSKYGTCSVWVNLQGTSLGTYYDLLVTGAGGGLFIRRNNYNRLQILGSNYGFSMQSTLTYNSSGWYHLLASWNLAAGIGHFYINDVDRKGTSNFNNVNHSHTGASYIGSQGGGYFKFKGFAAELWFIKTYIDLSDESNRRKFISTGGKPINLGANGSEPTGSQPIIFQSGATASWHTNKGTGGGYTLSGGGLTTASSSPSD